ncbi:MAG: alpha-amylase family glycosyl hydrolase [Candidatus Saccharimonadales bacterium]
MAVNEVFKEEVGIHFHGEKTSFRVWAPNAKSVSISGDFNDWAEIPLESENDGYWHAELEDLEPGAKYKYIIYTASGEKLFRNDPRGLQITDSSDGTSIVPDMQFDWEKDSYVLPEKEKIVIYEMHIGTFNRIDRATTGTFFEAIEKLDYLQNLGINVVELLPVTSMAQGYGWGYAPNYIYSVEGSYGGRRGLMEFVKACHKRGTGVILDTVYNHFDGDYLWQFDGWSENNGGGIYFYNDERGVTPWGARPDYGRPEVRQYVLDNIKMWLTDFHVDGIRMDSTIYMRNMMGYNNDPAHDIADGWRLMQGVNELTHSIDSGALTIAEDCSANDYITKQEGDGGAGFDAQWELSLPHSLRDVLEGKPWGIDDLCYSLFSRFNSDYMQKVCFADSHDSAANGGERILEQTHFGKENDADARRISILVSAVALTAPGMPMILGGQEFMQGGTFNEWKMLEWENVERFAGVVQAHSDLVDLRTNVAGGTGGLMGGEIEVFHKNYDNRVLGYRRFSQSGEDVLVLINFSDENFDSYDVQLPIEGDWKVRFNSSAKKYSEDFAEAKINDLVTGNDKMVNIELRERMVLILSR